MIQTESRRTSTAGYVKKVLLVCAGVAIVIGVGLMHLFSQDSNSSPRSGAQVDVQTSPAEDVVDANPAESPEASESDLSFQIVDEDGPSFDELGVPTPPSEDDVEAYKDWVDVYIAAYYAYLEEAGMTEPVLEEDAQVPEDEREQYEAYEKLFPENSDRN